MPHSILKPCIGDLIEFIRENNYLQWSLTKELQMENKKFKNLKNLRATISFLEQMETKYETLIEKRQEEKKKEILERGYLKYAEECQKEYKKLKNKQDNELSSFFGFLKKEKDEDALRKEAAAIVEEKLKYMALMNTWLLENYQGVTTKTIINYTKELALELSQAKNKVIKQMKEEMKKINDDFFEKIKIEAQKRLELKIKMEKEKEEIIKIKANAERMARLAEWKAWRASAKKEENEVFRTIQSSATETIKKVFQGKMMMIGGEKDNKLQDIVNEASDCQRRINEIRNEIRAVKSQKFIMKMGEHGGVYSNRYTSTFSKCNGDYTSVDDCRSQIIKQLEKQLEYYSVKRITAERKLKQY
jgi:hypothetical protein